MQLVTDPNAIKRRNFISLVTKYAKSGTGSSIKFLNQRTWTYSVSNLSQIITQADFVIVGGVATRLYMPERKTLDLDILIKAEDAQLVYQDLLNANGQKIVELSIQESQWQLEDGTSLEVLEGTGNWVADAIEIPNYAPDGLPIIKLSYLVLMKLIAGRSQDLADISRMLGGATEIALLEVRDIINQYLRNAIENLIILGKLEFQ